MKGIIPPLITPLVGRDALDHAGLEKLIERLITGGVHGLFIIGTTGEGPSLSYRLRRELITETCRRVNRRVPVFVGITDTAFVESVNIARHSADAGADAVVAAPPYYLPEAQPELLEYIRHLLPEMPLPLFLYNMPSLTKVSFDIDTVRALQDETQIHGIKDSSGNMVYFHRLCQLLKERPDWSVLMGPEELLLDSVFAGGHGGVNGGANIFPELYVALYDTAISSNVIRARELHALVMRISATLYQVGRHSSAIIKGIKCALSHLGVCDDFMAEPFHRFRDVERNRIAEALTLLKEEVSNLVP
jgi:4-hydroxy-tetrahydrodipicolinate synthase